VKIYIDEPGFRFGGFNIEDVFQIEKTHINASLGSRSVEFVLFHNENDLLFVEAKSSAPKPEHQENFDLYIEKISEKFQHSINTFFALILKRLDDSKNELPFTFRKIDYSEIEIILLLVIKGHKAHWLQPIYTALMHRLKRFIKTFRLKMSVINDEMADVDYHILAH
jgi:hypothetical protein